MKNFLKGRIELVKYLIDNEVPNVHYADLVLIITAVLSACASRRWKGKGIDKKRFIELLINHSPEDFHTSWVSVPALLNEGLIRKDQTPYGKPGHDIEVFRDGEIDMSIEDARKRYPEVPCKKLKKFCYASLIYEWLRCGYSHEYWAHENITHVPATRRNARVSYIARGTNNGTRIMVSFHPDYLIKLAEHHVSILPCSSSELPCCWWIEQQ
jgi:hypothetical protein